MLFNTPFCRALPAFFLLIVSHTTAQQCYYPDGSPSTDTPCSPSQASPCCAADSFCLANGLCFGNGIISRGSCTDEAWGSEACTQYCRSASPDSSVQLAPCSSSANSSVFVCGLQTVCNGNTAFDLQGASSFILRPAQVAALAGPAIASAHAAGYNESSLNSTHLYPLEAMIGVGVGLGIPFIVTLLSVIFILRRRTQHEIPSSLLYNLPDGEKSDFAFGSRPGTGGGGSGIGIGGGGSQHLSVQQSPVFSSHLSSHLSTSQYSDQNGMRSPLSGLYSPPPPQMIARNQAGYVEQYATFKDPGGGSSGPVVTVGPVSHARRSRQLIELDSTEKEVVRVELAARTKSNKSTRSSRTMPRQKPRMRQRQELGDYR